LRRGSKTGLSGLDEDRFVFLCFRLDFDFVLVLVEDDFLDRTEGEQLGDRVDNDVKLEHDSCSRE